MLEPLVGQLQLVGDDSALALEGVGVVLALSRIGSRPGPALLSLALSAAVVGVAPPAKFGRRVPAA